MCVSVRKQTFIQGIIMRCHVRLNTRSGPRTGTSITYVAIHKTWRFSAYP